MRSTKCLSPKGINVRGSCEWQFLLISVLLGPQSSNNFRRQVAQPTGRDAESIATSVLKKKLLLFIVQSLYKHYF